MMNLNQKTPSFFRFLTKIQKMIRLALICMLLILIASCAKEQDDLDKNLTIGGQKIYAAGYYIDGYPNGVQYASYWVNGERVSMGEGEVTDIFVQDNIVYASGYDESSNAVYWVDGEKKSLQGKGTMAHSIYIHNDDVYVAGSFSNGSCYWKNGSKINLTTGADSEAFGIVLSEDGEVYVGGYYMNNHHYLIPARWNGTQRRNLTKPKGGDGEVYDVVLKNGTTPIFLGMSMAPNNMVGYVPKASYWIGNKRIDCDNGGTWKDNVYGGEAFGGFVHGDDVYLAGNVQYIGLVDSDGNEIEGKGGIFPHYWKNGNIHNLSGGPVYDNYWVGGGKDIFVSDSKVVVGGWASSNDLAQVAAIWVDGQLIYLEDEQEFSSVVNSIFVPQ